MSARYIARSIQDDRLALAARDRLLLGAGSDNSKAVHAGLRIAVASRFAHLAARVSGVAPTTPH